MIATVSFGISPKLYDYYTDQNLKKGDLVVVPAGESYQVAWVHCIKKESTKAEKWVVQKVDFTHYKALLAMQEGLFDE